jgi:hypothetical protein
MQYHKEHYANNIIADNLKKMGPRMVKDYILTMVCAPCKGLASTPGLLLTGPGRQNQYLEQIFSVRRFK